MAASQRVQILTDKAEELSVLRQFLENPKLIESLQDEVKKLNELTEQESAKLNDARKLLNDHPVVVKALDAQRSDIEAQKSALEIAKASHAADAQNLTEQQAKLKSYNDELNKKNLDLAVNLAQLQKDRKALDEYKAALEKEHQTKLDAVTAKSNENENQWNANIAESKRLFDYKMKLESATANIKNLVAD